MPLPGNVVVCSCQVKNVVQSQVSRKNTGQKENRSKLTLTIKEGHSFISPNKAWTYNFNPFKSKTKCNLLFTFVSGICTNKSLSTLLWFTPKRHQTVRQHDRITAHTCSAVPALLQVSCCVIHTSELSLQRHIGAAIKQVFMQHNIHTALKH